MKLSKFWRITSLILALSLLIGSIFLIRSCSAPPEYEAVKARLKELVERSYEIDVIFFGEGLPTYERIFDPLDSLEVYSTGELSIVNGAEKERKVWYYFPLLPEDVQYRIVAFRDSYLDGFSYGYIAAGEQESTALAELFPALEGVTAPEGKSFYTEVFRSKESGEVCYLIPYVEEKAEFYYSSTDPDDYDYVRDDSKFQTVSQIKEYAATVYSRNYLRSLYGSLFDGVASGGDILKARFVEQFREDGSSSWLTQLNTDKPLFTEQRMYLYDSGKIEWGSNNKSLIISIDSYLPSAPEKIQRIELNLVLQDNIWYLDTPTF